MFYEFSKIIFSIQNGMTLVLDVESFDYAYFPRGSRGFRVALSNANDQAAIYQVRIWCKIVSQLFILSWRSFQDGFYIASGTETLAAITPTILRTTNNTLERFEPSIRDCYLDSEFGFPNLKWSDGYRFSIKVYFKKNRNEIWYLISVHPTVLL